jgi:hypothetical protein
MPLSRSIRRLGQRRRRTHPQSARRRCSHTPTIIGTSGRQPAPDRVRPFRRIIDDVEVPQDEQPDRGHNYRASTSEEAEVVSEPGAARIRSSMRIDSAMPLPSSL